MRHIELRAVNTRKHAGYAKSYAEYAAAYSVSARAIAKWVNFGKQVEDLPPLDDSSSMASWWARVMKHRVPEKLIVLAKQIPAGTASPVPTGTESAPPPPPPQRDFSELKSLDMAANVEALRQTLAVDKHLLDEARTNNDAVNTPLRERNYRTSFELLRKAELTLIEIEKKRGTVVDRDAVTTEVSQVLESLRIMRQTMADRVLLELAKTPGKRMIRVLRLITPYLHPAIETVRANEEHIFRDLSCLEGPGAVAPLLAA